MIPVDMARVLTQKRHRELLRAAERRRLIAALPAGPGRLQRFALRVAGWGRRWSPAVRWPRRPAYEPSAA